MPALRYSQKVIYSQTLIIIYFHVFIFLFMIFAVLR